MIFGDRVTTSVEIFEEKEKLKAEEKYQAEVSKPVERVNSQNQIDRDHCQIIYLVVILSFMSFVGIFKSNEFKNSAPLNTQTINK